MSIRNMQGVSAHLEFLQDTEKKRRHKSRCKNIVKPQKICDAPKSPYFQKNCGGSSHCAYYEEN